MKKIFFITTVLFLFIPLFVIAQECPFDEVDCTGECGRYVDGNGDAYCDYGEISVDNTVSEGEDLITGQELKTKTVKQVADIYNISAVLFAQRLSDFYKVKIRISDNFQLLHDNYGLEPSIAKDIASSIALGKDTVDIPKSAEKNQYSFLSIISFLTILYIVTYFLYKKNIISRTVHFRFWNVLLLFTFLGVGLSGIFLVLRINYGININWPFNVLHFHVEIGIAMTIISFFHTLWHWQYYKNIFKKNN